MDGRAAPFKGSQERKRVPVQAAAGGRHRLSNPRRAHLAAAGHRQWLSAASASDCTCVTSPMVPGLATAWGGDGIGAAEPCLAQRPSEPLSSPLDAKSVWGRWTFMRSETVGTE